MSNLVKARAAQRRSGALHHHTARQKAASRQNLVKARAAQKSRRSGKTPVSHKAAQAPYPQLNLGLPALVPNESGDSLHLLPLCAAVAVAASLREQTGIVIPDESLLAWHESVQGGRICDLLEAAAGHGLAGRRLLSYEPAAPDLFFPGLVYGIRLSTGYHAVLTTRGGMLSWGMVLPLLGTPEEAWILEWE